MSRRDINRLIDIRVALLLRGVNEVSLCPYDIYRAEVKDIKDFNAANWSIVAPAFLL